MTDPSKTTKVEDGPIATETSSTMNSVTTPAMTPDFSRSVTRRIRVRSADSAFVYAILEASEGACAYSTLPHRPGDHYRDLELIVPIGQVNEVDQIVAELTAELSGEVYVLPIESEPNPVDPE